MSLEIFTPPRIVTRGAKIAILPTGVFWINFVARKKFFAGFKRTFLLYDRERQVIGFRPTNEEHKYTYSLSGAEHRNDNLVFGKTFLEYFQIPRERNTYEPRWNAKERVVEIDLGEPL